MYVAHQWGAAVLGTVPLVLPVEWTPRAISQAIPGSPALGLRVCGPWNPWVVEVAEYWAISGTSEPCLVPSGSRGHRAPPGAEDCCTSLRIPPPGIRARCLRGQASCAMTTEPRGLVLGRGCGGYEHEVEDVAETT